MNHGKGFLAAALLGLCASAIAEDSTVTVGSTRYLTSVAGQSGDKSIRLKLTGTAMRTMWTFKVYSIASYVQEDAVVRTPEALASAAVPKKLCLTFERTVASADLAKSFREAVALNHPAPAFKAELDALAGYFEAHPVSQGNSIWLSSEPNAGFHCQLVGAPALALPNDKFAQAVWEVYLGPKNLGAAIKTGLTSRR
ncbi:chalcone isomerase family protein [Paludisphaera rhizosphaerae]|uniref:chalcone isomerase family protein n=1 Tax=Paludisphaera rhizosphaerae TaxID=2711216 RepID=UPI0013EB2561|nr:chalcone isomerase family protein [Paludisphaera rhizosphaerae]